MEVTLTELDGGGDAIFRVDVQLTEAELSSVGGDDFVFDIPTLDNWLFREDDNSSDEDRRHFTSPDLNNTTQFPFLGRVHEGRWVFILQRNGTQNPNHTIMTEREVARRLEAAISAAMASRSGA